MAIKLDTPDINARLDQIEKMQASAARKVQQLRFYIWLERHGLSWDQIKAAAHLPDLRGAVGRYQFVLRDDTMRVLTEVPFDEDVILQRKEPT